MSLFSDDEIAQVLLFAIPIVAIAGGILTSVVRTLSHHRLMETALRERMALMARGRDAGAGPAGAGRGFPVPARSTPEDHARWRAQELLVTGFVLFVGGVSFAVVIGSLDGWEMGDWALGVIAATAGLALLVSGLLVRPRRRAESPGVVGSAATSGKLD